MGFTPVDFMPPAEPAFYLSGLSGHGFLRATAALAAEDFPIFVNALHEAGSGVIIAWVAAPFRAIPGRWRMKAGACRA